MERGGFARVRASLCGSAFLEFLLPELIKLVKEHTLEVCPALNYGGRVQGGLRLVREVIADGGSDDVSRAWGGEKGTVNPLGRGGGRLAGSGDMEVNGNMI
jgi:hypothetical protein